MKNKLIVKLFALLLCIAALLSFAACAGTDPAGEQTSEESTAGEAKLAEFDFSKYKVVRPDTFGTDATKVAVQLRKDLNAAFGVEMSIITDWDKNGLTQELIDAYEILFGNTNRPQSAKALEGTDGTSFVIALIDNKIVINAGKESLLKDAVDFFMSKIKDGKLELTENYLYVSPAIGSVDVVKNGKSDYVLVYKEGLDATESSTNEKDKCDVEPAYCKEFKSYLKQKTGADVSLAVDWVKTEEEKHAKKEILVGECDRTEYYDFLKQLDYNQWGVKVSGNKVIIAGWNLTTLTSACERFKTIVTDNLVKNEDGTKSLSLLSTFEYIGSTDGWFVDFPKPDTDIVPKSMDCSDNTLEFYYEKIGLQPYQAYVASLKSAGYKVFQENNIEDNLFTTLENEKGLIYVYYTPADKSMRLITSPVGKYALPDCPTQESVAAYTKVTDTKITAMGLNYALDNFGNCFVITLEDGSFFVYDGGGYSAEYGDDAKLWNLLKSLNKRPDGKIVIAAWMLSHEHWDHFTNFYNVCIAHGKEMTIEACYLNTPAASFVTNSNNPNNYVRAGKLEEMITAVGGAKVVKIHTGMEYWVRNAKFQVLFTQDDILPGRCNYFNETSNVIKMTAGGQTVVWLGDSKNYASNTMTKRFQKTLKADIVQVGHHGFDSVNETVYRYIGADTLLWPTSQSNITAFKNKTKNYAADNYLFSVHGLDDIIVADPTHTITLPYKKGDTIENN